LQPYLAINRDLDDMQLLLRMPALKEIKIQIDYKYKQWHY